MGIVVEGNDSRVICVLCDNLHNRRKPGWRNYMPQRSLNLATKDGSCWESSSSSLTPRKLTPIVIDDVDVDSANPEILTVQEDEDGNEDDDVEIHI